MYSLFRQLRGEVAIEDFSKAIELDPKNADAYHNRGNVYAKELRYQEAILDYSKAIELEPTIAKYYSRRGETNMLLGLKSDTI